VPVIVELVLLHGNTRYIILVDVIQTLNVFRRLEQRLREIGIVTPTAIVNAGRPRTVRRPANEDVIIVDVEREPWTRTGISQPWVLEVLHDDQYASIPLIAERTCFQTIILYGCNFAKGYDINTLRMSSFYSIFCGQTKRVLRIIVWPGTVGDNAVGHYLLPDRLTAQRYRDFLETVLPGLLEDVPLAVRQKLWFQHDAAPAHYVEDVWQWFNSTCPGKWIERGGLIPWPPRSPDLTPMDFFPVGTPEGASLRSPSQDCWRSRGSTSNSCDNGRCQRVKACSRECRAAHCRLPWNGRRPLRKPIVTTRNPWFDHLIAYAIWRWRVSWKLNVTGHKK
jgi:hypothetical protein